MVSGRLFLPQAPLACVTRVPAAATSVHQKDTQAFAPHRRAGGPARQPLRQRRGDARRGSAHVDGPGPSWTAIERGSAALCTPSLLIRLARCTATVLTLRPSTTAISLFDLPCAISCSTCFSRFGQLLPTDGRTRPSPLQRLDADRTRDSSGVQVLLAGGDRAARRASGRCRARSSGCSPATPASRALRTYCSSAYM